MSGKHLVVYKIKWMLLSLSFSLSLSSPLVLLLFIYLFITFLVCKAVFSGPVDKGQPCGNGAVP